MRVPAGLRQPAPRRDVFESAVAPIAVQDVAIDAGDEQVLPSVVVVIGGGNARREALAPNSGGNRDIGERSIAVVAIQPVVEGRIGFIELRLAGAVHEVQVRLAVVVVIENGNSADHWLDLPLLGRCGVSQDEVDACARARCFRM